MYRYKGDQFMKTINFTDFRKNASTLLSGVENGDTLIVLRHGKAVAEIGPPRGGTLKRMPSWKKPGIRLKAEGAALSLAILEERKVS
jgi:antitoxin (DNA-binding transcriptional repressor) of toxin-antitoxin stability system